MNNSFKTVNLLPIPAGSNPFEHDAYHMGTQLGSNCTVMFENHSEALCKYLIICDTNTGKRVKVLFPGVEDSLNLSEFLTNSSRL